MNYRRSKLQNPSRRWRPSVFLRWSAALHAVAALDIPRAPQRRRLWGALLAANHLLIAGAGLWPRGRLLGPNLCREDDDRRSVALSFDDGPDPRVTPEVLEQLEVHKARASFFCIGRRAERHLDLVAEIATRGHLIENHTYTHSPLFSLYGPAAIEREIGRAQQVLEHASGRRPRWLRAPAGLRNLFLEPLLCRFGLRLVSWTRRGFDTVERSPRRVADRLLRDVAPGDVLLLHDGSAARDRHGRPVVLEALPRVLDGLAIRGLSARPVGGSGETKFR